MEQAEAVYEATNSLNEKDGEFQAEGLADSKVSKAD